MTLTAGSRRIAQVTLEIHRPPYARRPFAGPDDIDVAARIAPDAVAYCWSVAIRWWM
jgi:hypothetical protein